MGVGGGIFELQEFFFVIKFFAWILFRPLHEYFLGLIGVHEFFSFNFPLREYFFCTSPPPPLSFLMVRPLYIKVLCHKFYYYWGEEYRSFFMPRDEPATARRNAL